MYILEIRMTGYELLCLKLWLEPFFQKKSPILNSTRAISVYGVSFIAAVLFQDKNKKNFGGIPNSRSVIFLQIFLKRAAKPSAGNTSGYLWLKWTWPSLASANFSGARWAWLGFAARLRNLLRSLVEPHLALHQSLPDLLRNLLRNPVEPDLALAPVHTGA